MSKELTPEECVKEARHVTWVGFWWNAALGLAKVVGGAMSRSGALIADGVHSFSDFLSDLIVLVMVGIAARSQTASIFTVMVNMRRLPPSFCR